MCTSETYEVRTLCVCVFVCVCVCVCVRVCKNKEFKTALMTSFILLMYFQKKFIQLSSKFLVFLK